MMNVERRQVAADPQTKLNNLSCEFACRLPESTPTIATFISLHTAFLKKSKFMVKNVMQVETSNL